MTNRRLVGHIGVDSGTVVIVDPHNLDAVDHAFDEMIERTGTECVSRDGLVICPTGLGDGFYPVFIETAELDNTFNGERVVRIVIDCGLTDTQRQFLERERAEGPNHPPPGSWS
jgi:hypothetical protein